MANATTIAVDQPPLPQTSDGYEGSYLAVPPLDADFFSLNDGVEEDLNYDFGLDFNFDDLDELLSNTDSQPLPDADYDQFNLVFDSFSSELRGDTEFSGDHSSNLSNNGIFEGCVGLRDCPEIGSQEDVKLPNFSSPDSQGDTKILNCNSPESRGSGNCNSDVSNSINNVVVDQKVKNGVDGSLLKRKKNFNSSLSNLECQINKCRKSNSGEGKNNNNSDGLNGDDDKRKARLMRNRESAQLSRQRKKNYVEELEGKVKTMHSTIQELNARVSQVIAENAALRQQMGGGGNAPNPYVIPRPPPGMYPYPGLMYPWMPYAAPPYMVKQGSQVPLVPIPKLKPSIRGKDESRKNDGKRTKKVTGVSILGLLFFMMLFGVLVPMVNVRYGGAREALTDGDSYVRAGFDENHHGRVLMVNGTSLSGGSGDGCARCGYDSVGKNIVKEFTGSKNDSESLVASLYVPRNDKLVKIDGNLIIQSVLASEKAMSSHRTGSDETGLAVQGYLAPAVPVRGNNGDKYSHLRALGSGSENDGNVKQKLTEGPLQQLFLEGLAGPMLRSGMCTEVFQFDASPTSTKGAIIPATSTRNITKHRNQNNSTRLGNRRNRRVLHNLPLPLSGSSHNVSPQRNTQRENVNRNSSVAPMVVSVLVDPKEMGDTDLDGVMGTKSISRVFVVVLIDSVKYVTYSCMLPFKGSGTQLVTG